jgi:hypothetical protein
MEKHWESDLLPKIKAHNHRNSKTIENDMCFIAEPCIMVAAWSENASALQYGLHDNGLHRHRTYGWSRREIVINISDLIRSIGAERVWVDTAAKAKRQVQEAN